jgi:hypothetical protein
LLVLWPTHGSSSFDFSSNMWHLWCNLVLRKFLVSTSVAFSGCLEVNFNFFRVLGTFCLHLSCWWNFSNCPHGFSSELRRWKAREPFCARQGYIKCWLLASVSTSWDGSQLFFTILLIKLIITIKKELSSDVDRYFSTYICTYYALKSESASIFAALYYLLIRVNKSMVNYSIIHDAIWIHFKSNLMKTWSL